MGFAWTLQQPAGRDPEGERNSRLYGDPWMQQMQGLEQELRATFQKCEEERLLAARQLGWFRRDVDWVKQARSELPSKRMVSITVQVPRQGTRSEERRVGKECRL